MAQTFEQWVSTINNEIMADFIAKKAAVRIRSKSNFDEGRTTIYNFMKKLIKGIKNLNEHSKDILLRINPLIGYTLGIVKHSMFSSLKMTCNLFE